MQKIYARIEGIHCVHCEEKITQELLKNKKIQDVKIIDNIAHIVYKGPLEKKEIIDAILGIDYITKEEYITDDLKAIDTKIKLKEFLIILAIILIIWFSIYKIFDFNIFNVIPNIDLNLTYGMLFITGILTSIHCISMCGAINLMAIVDSKQKNFKRPLLYNLGRVASYTLIGGIVGFLGSVISLNSTINGIIILLAALIMFMMSLSMLGIIKFKLSFMNKMKFKRKSKSAFVIGLLNGLMPCGPLQAMQVYALSTGSFIRGALSMFLFSLGTVPLMLFVGIIFNLFKGKRKILLNNIASILIMLLSLVMVNRGLLALNIDIFKNFKGYGDYTPAVLVGEKQVVEFDLSYNNYQDIIVQEGIPVQMIIHVDKKYLTGCNDELSIKELKITKRLEVGDNIIEFTPTKTGTYTYSCWMDMIRNNIKIIDDKNYFKKMEEE